MDHTLRRYQKRYAADPYDAEAAGEYIRVLERTLRGVVRLKTVMNLIYTLCVMSQHPVR